MLRYLLLLFILVGCGGRHIPVPIPPAPQPQPEIIAPEPIPEWKYEGAVPSSMPDISAYFQKALTDINTVRPTNPEYDEGFFREATRLVFRATEGYTESGSPYFLDSFGRRAHGNFNPFVAPWLLEVLAAVPGALWREFLHEIWFANWPNEVCLDGITRVWREIGHGGLCDPLRVR